MTTVLRTQSFLLAAPLLLAASSAFAQSASQQACQQALGEKIASERRNTQLTVISSETFSVSRGVQAVKGKATLKSGTTTESIEFACRVEEASPRVLDVTFTAAPALAPIATSQAAERADNRAVKPCQEDIRNKVKSEHGDVSVTFESVETSSISADVVGVKGRLRMGKGNDATTMNYLCRVDVKEMKVKRAEYGKEN